MPSSVEQFLRYHPRITTKASLGRVFSVTRETWKLTDDPKRVRPKRELVASGRTASDAADLARAAAEGLPRHGFHKPSGAWWAADEKLFHRFLVRAGRRPNARTLVVVSTLAGLAGVALTRAQSTLGGGKEV